MLNLMPYREEGPLWEVRRTLDIFNPDPMGVCHRKLNKLASDLMYDLGFLEDTCRLLEKRLKQEKANAAKPLFPC